MSYEVYHPYKKLKNIDFVAWDNVDFLNTYMYLQQISCYSRWWNLSSIKFGDGFDWTLSISVFGSSKNAIWHTLTIFNMTDHTFAITFLGSFMKTISAKAGLSTLYTNHCAMFITSLNEHGIGADHIMSVGWLISETSIKSFIRYVYDIYMGHHSLLIQQGSALGFCHPSCWWLSIKSIFTLIYLI